MKFFLNGEDLGSAFLDFTGPEIFPAMSLNVRQSVRINFGHYRFQYPPDECDGKAFQAVWLAANYPYRDRKGPKIGTPGGTGVGFGVGVSASAILLEASPLAGTGGGMREGVGGVEAVEGGGAGAGQRGQDLRRRSSQMDARMMIHPMIGESGAEGEGEGVRGGGVGGGGMNLGLGLGLGLNLDYGKKDEYGNDETESGLQLTNEIDGFDDLETVRVAREGDYGIGIHGNSSHDDESKDDDDCCDNVGSILIGEGVREEDERLDGGGGGGGGIGRGGERGRGGGRQGGEGREGRPMVDLEWGSSESERTANLNTIGSNFLDSNRLQGQGEASSGIGNVSDNGNSSADGSHTTSK